MTIPVLTRVCWIARRASFWWGYTREDSPGIEDKLILVAHGLWVQLKAFCQGCFCQNVCNLSEGNKNIIY